MHLRLIAIAGLLTTAGCAATGYSGSAYVTAGIIELEKTTPTVEECAEAVRTVTKIPDPSHLGRRIVQRQGAPPEGVMGICSGPDGRTYFIKPNSIEPGPTVVFER